ncbi:MULTISPECIES: lactate utilization protein C [unclassified Arthrobacter]|uniref:LutC/YkgG family protein n=1 Tax=unclassified Arthrobacter TaxID=235627 RepID=UPI001E2B3B6B|nr:MULTISPECIES: lactate utilization protein C [unclassified Arthrobacter]MCC9145991.1 lactate utilization protein C [Arthrobacter sp. zg-Y919]MDK1277220.1 lactate utilization protein C [Arthrobacter sp. zg.Y919]WIB03734.1 lactate utilization protein C [Arthrobacter sp. zg-Y919]
MSARTEILDRLRAALHDSPEAPEIPRKYRHTSGMSEDELIELLSDRLLDYKAGVSVVDEASVPARVAELLAGEKSYVVPAGLDERWTALVPGRVVDSPQEPLSVEELDGIDAVVTGSAAAVAETGTIILDGSPGQGRRACSLIPDHHVCIVKAGDIAGVLPEAVRRLDVTHPLTWISGPSATSDIELERVEGVHGPRRLDVVIVR